MINRTKLAYVTSKFGTDYTIANETAGEITYHCPYCPNYGKRNNDRKLYVNVNKLVYDCKRCGTHGSLHSSDAELFEDSTTLNDLFPKNDVDLTSFYQIPKNKLIDFPESTAYKYMAGRGFTPNDMIKYSMRLPSTKDDGKLMGRVVIPNKIVYNDDTDMFTARSFVGHSNRYYNPPNSQKSKILFNIQNIEPNPDYLILNEGPLNSIIAGDYSVASYGKILSNAQFKLIKDLHPKEIYISYDTDAEEQSEFLCKKFLEYTDIIPHKVMLPDNKDAVDLGHERYLDIVLNTKKYTCFTSLLDLFEGWRV